MRETDQLRVFHTGDHVCGYFPERIARDLVIDPRDPRLPQAYPVALGWGFPVEEVAARLLEQSSKAREPGQGERYAQITVENAAASIKRETSAKPQIRPA